MSLTPVEQEILRLMMVGLSNTEIARMRGCTHHTVRNVNTHLFKRLHVRTRVEAVVLAYHLGMEPADAEVRRAGGVRDGGVRTILAVPWYGCPVRAARP